MFWRKKIKNQFEQIREEFERLRDELDTTRANFKQTCAEHVRLRCEADARHMAEIAKLEADITILNATLQLCRDQKNGYQSQYETLLELTRKHKPDEIPPHSVTVMIETAQGRDFGFYDNGWYTLKGKACIVSDWWSIAS